MAGLSFTQNLKKLFARKDSPDESFFEDLADNLIEGDLGPKIAFEIAEQLEKICRQQRLTDHGAIREQLAAILTSCVKTVTVVPETGKTSVYLVLGVNGVGKTTTVAKMAHWYKTQTSEPLIIAAADTFRAAAIEQLTEHGKRLGLRVVAHQHGSDPGAVVYDAAAAVRSAGGGLVLADTAGRLHNKDNLVRELQKIDRIASERADPGCYKKFLVIDATTGQNGLRQAEVFHEAVGVNAVILTKYDSTARGGIAITAGKELGLPVAFIGSGETYSDFSEFSADAYISDFLGH